MPFSTQMIATAPLGAEAREILPTDMCVEDVRYILDYYRLSADGRLLFGGGTVYGGTDPADIRAKLVPNLGRVFPQLKDVAVDYAWSGNCALSFSRVPQMGRLGSGDLLRLRLFRARGGRAAISSGGSSPQAVDGDLAAVRRFRQRAVDAVPRRPAVPGSLFRARIVVVWSARPPRRLTISVSKGL